MVRFELKKVFSKMSSKIALLLLAALFAMTVYYAISEVVWLGENEEEVSGAAAAGLIREAGQEWYGPLTEEKIADVITDGWSFGNSGIRLMMIWAYGGMQSFDSTVLETLTAEDAADFYGNRVARLKEWLEDMGDWYTEGEKAFLTEQYEEMETPLDYEYAEGWETLFPKASSLQMFILLVTGFLTAGIFSEEYRTGADAVFFSAAYGRGKAIRAKLKAGFWLITLVYWITFGAFTAVVLLTLGSGGAGCMIQINIIGWKSFYNITFFQEYLLMAAGGYIGCLFTGTVAMLVSAKTKSAVPAVVTPFVLLFAPAIVKVAASPLAEKAEGLMPYQLVQINSALCEFYLYKFGGRIIGSVGILLVLYGILTVILQPGIYLVFQKGER